MEKYVLKIYIAGQTVTSQAAIKNLNSMCEEQLKGRYEMTIVNVLENPQAAEIEKILATPTLIKELPEPVRRIIGDLSEKEKVLVALDIHNNPCDQKEVK